MKAYTDKEQSKTLSKFLPLSSADMRYAPFGDTHPWFNEDSLMEIDSIPCWSLEKLLELIKVDIIIEKFEFDQSGEFLYDITYGDCRTTVCSELIDACYELIIKLHKQKVL